MGYQLVAYIKAIYLQKVEASKGMEATLEHKAEVGCLLAEVEYLQEVLKKEEQASTGLSVALTLEEEKRRPRLILLKRRSELRKRLFPPSSLRRSKRKLR